MPFSPPSAEKPLHSHHSPSPQTRVPSPGFSVAEARGHTGTRNCKRFNLQCLPLRQRRQELLMIGFIWPIFRRMSEVNSTAITAQLVLTHCLGSHTPPAQSWGTGRMTAALEPQHWEPDGFCDEQHLAVAAAGSLLPFAFPALLTPAAPGLTGLRPRAAASAAPGRGRPQRWPRLQTLAAHAGHGTARAAGTSEPSEHCCASSWVVALACASRESLRNT